MRSTHAPIRISLEIDATSEPIAGAVFLEGSEHVPFTGWLALIAALEGALACGRGGPDAT